MREFTKSMMSYTWAMSLFGVQQMVNVFRPSKAVESFDKVTEATEEEFGDAVKAAFRAGDNLQQGMVDLTFSLFTFGRFDRGGGRGSSRVASDVGQQSAEAFRQGMRAAGQTADAVGQAVQGTAYATADAARRGATGWASQSQRDTGRGAGDTSDRGAGYGTSSGVAQQTADAVGQGIRAVGRAADAVGQTIEGAAYATAAAVGGAGDQTTTQGTGAVRDDDAYGRRADANARRDASSGASGGQAQGWGPMPSQPSRPSGR